MSDVPITDIGAIILPQAGADHRIAYIPAPITSFNFKTA
jgi:hypothetical protein